MIPSVGRIVHYKSRGSADGVYEPACRAAVITDICEDPDHSDPGTQCVALTVLNPEGLFIHPHIQQNDWTYVGGTWHWPEQV